MCIRDSFLEWATSPWGQNVPIHIAWFLIWVSAIAGLLFLIVHAIYMMYFAKARVFASDASPAAIARIPKHVPRHSLVARLFHWVMAASMFTLLFTAFPVSYTHLDVYKRQVLGHYRPHVYEALFPTTGPMPIVLLSLIHI